VENREGINTGVSPDGNKETPSGQGTNGEENKPDRVVVFDDELKKMGLEGPDQLLTSYKEAQRKISSSGTALSENEKQKTELADKLEASDTLLGHIVDYASKNQDLRKLPDFMNETRNKMEKQAIVKKQERERKKALEVSRLEKRQIARELAQLKNPDIYNTDTEPMILAMADSIEAKTIQEQIAGAVSQMGKIEKFFFEKFSNSKNELAGMREAVSSVPSGSSKASVLKNKKEPEDGFGMSDEELKVKTRRILAGR